METECYPCIPMHSASNQKRMNHSTVTMIKQEPLSEDVNVVDDQDDLRSNMGHGGVATRKQARKHAHNHGRLSLNHSQQQQHSSRVQQHTIRLSRVSRYLFTFSRVVQCAKVFQKLWECDFSHCFSHKDFIE